MLKHGSIRLFLICIPSLVAWPQLSSGASIIRWTMVGGYQGDASIEELIQGQDTHFVQGQTQCDFGPGIQVRSVKVHSPTRVVVAIRIDRFAPLGKHPVTIVTGDERLTGPTFEVSALVTPLGAEPDGLTVRVATKVMFTTKVPPLKGLVVQSVRVERVDDKNQVISVLGELRDDGVQPDLVAGDGVFTRVLPLKEDKLGTIKLRASVAFAGQTQPSISEPLSIEVLSPDIPMGYKPPNLTKTVHDRATGADIVANEVIVSFVEGTPSDVILQDAKLVNGQITSRILGGSFVLILPDDPTGKNVNAAIAVLRTKPEVKFAEADTISSIQ